MSALNYRDLPRVRALLPLYYVGTRCPGCGHGGWHVGHCSAECARCGTVLPLAPVAHDHAAQESPAA